MLEFVKPLIYTIRYYLCAFFAVLFLFLYIFGIKIFVLTFIACTAFTLGCLALMLQHGWERSDELIREFESINLCRSTGIPSFINTPKPRSRVRPPRMTGSTSLDPIIEDIISLIVRDFIDSWYQSISDDTHKFQDALRITMHSTVASISSQLRQVDWVPFLTQQLVDDFASHMRLYRLAKERAKTSEDSLESIFFDLELEMEKSCRDLVSTTAQYENAYLHDVTDSLLYLLLPPQDFRCRPQRFLIREVIVRKVLLPFVDMLCDADYVNSTITWLLEDIPLNSDDFISILESTDNIAELEAILESIEEEMSVQRAKDTGDEEIKQQLNSLQFVKKIAVSCLIRLGGSDAVDSISICEEVVTPKPASYQLPIDVVLHDSLSVDYFIDFVKCTCGIEEKTYIDLYLAIEGYKSVVDHERATADLERITNPKPDGGYPDISAPIRETAKGLFHKYLSNEAAVALVDVDKSVIDEVERLVYVGEPIDQRCFDDVQLQIYNLLKRDSRFYPGFVKSQLYIDMLADTNLADRASLTENNATSAEDAADSVSIRSDDSGNIPEYSSAYWNAGIGDSPLQAKICSVGVARENNGTYGVYYVQVMRKGSEGDALWNVLRRYSEFFTFHNDIVAKFPNLSAAVRFPGKKIRSSVSRELLEKRMHSLNIYMQTILQSSFLANNDGLIEMAMLFLQQRHYGSAQGSIQKTFMSVMNPIKTGVKAFGSAVISAPDKVYDGVTRVGGGIGKVTKNVLTKAGSITPGGLYISPRSLRNIDVPACSVRVSAGLLDIVEGASVPPTDNIPLRILLLLMDEVFGLRKRNQWFRRQLNSTLKGLVNAAFGAQINKKIVDLVLWLTSENQVAQYLTAFKNSFWPNGVLAETLPERSQSILMRTRVVARVKMFAVLPDELRLFIGAETSRSGIELIFEALQNPHLNRRLTYVLLEHFLIILFPSNKMKHIFDRLHSKSPRFQLRSHD